MYRELIRNQLERIAKARTGEEQYDYLNSVETLALLLPYDMTKYVSDWKAQHPVTNRETTDALFLFIKDLISNSSIRLEEGR